MSELKFELFHHSALVEIPKIEEVTKGGIIKPEGMIAEETRKTEQYLKVVLVSPSIKNLEAGDEILLKVGGMPMADIEGVRYGLVDYSEILGRRLK